MGSERAVKGTISTLVLVGVWLLLGAGGAAAQDYTRDGWYVGARGLWGLEDFDTGGTGASVDDEPGFDVYAGYRMGRNFAGEIEFEYFDGFDVQGTSGELRLFSVALGMKVFPLARLFEPSSIYQRVQPYVTAAPSWQWAQIRGFGSGLNEDDGGFAGRFGAGLEIYLTNRFVLTGDASYSLPTGGAGDFNYGSFGGGLQWRFAGPED